MKISVLESLNYSKKKNILYIYLIYISLTLFLCFIYSKLNLSKFPNIILDDNNVNYLAFQFDHPLLFKSIFESNEFFQEVDGIKYYIAKLPIFPLLITFFLKIYDNYYFLFLGKSFLTFSFFFTIIYLYVVNSKNSISLFLLLLASTIIIPYNLHVYFNIYFADCISSVLFSCLFVYLLNKENKNFYLISLIIFILYLTKSSMFFVTIFIPIYLIFSEKKMLKYLPTISLLIAILLWGFYGLNKSNFFPFMKSASSHGSKQFSVVMNKNFSEYYPTLSVDLIQLAKIPDSIKNEKEAFDFYDNLNQVYFSNNYLDYIKDRFLILKFIFFEIKSDGHKKKSEAKIRYSNIINRIALIISIIILLFNLKKNKFNIKALQRIDILLILFLIGGIIPLFAGWATHKHLVGIFQISFFYLTIKFYKYFQKKI